MSLIEIKNKNTIATIDTNGAQLVALKVDGVDILFDGALKPEKAQWPASAKNLFPNPGPVGTTNDQLGELETVDLDVGNGTSKKHVIYQHNGGKYAMTQHGFAQYKDFNVQGKTETSCLMSITHNDGTWSEYPYKFKYAVGMDVDENGNFVYSTFARNDDTKPMLAGFGWHPAFKLHGDPSRYRIVVTNLVPGENCTLEEGKEYTIEELVREGKSEIFTGIKSADITLVYKKENGKTLPYLTMHTDQPTLVLWSKPATEKSQSNFICIEPWNTTPRQIQKLTTQDKTRSLAEGDNPANIIEPGEHSTMIIPVSVNPQYIKQVCKHKSKTKE